jgi:Response receiver domain
MSATGTFADQRLAATREFAHTMIVVDDEAWKAHSLTATPRAGLRPPRRGVPLPGVDSSQQEMFLIRHALDTEQLVSAAMDLGLICSVIRPPKGKSITAQVGSAAKRADIVCLDWELHNDGGNSATQIITEIARSDEKRNGRLRLIAIYTGDMNNNQILEKVFTAFSKSYQTRFKLKRDAVRIESNHGLRIVCLFKAHGIQLADARKERQVKEIDLPERLQKEFALLAGGLLSNVALATIASIRDSTHHVLAKMTESMDAPYFHHRAVLPMASDAEEYSVDLVLSDLKSAVDKRGVAQKYAGPDAIAARIREIAHHAPTLHLRYEAAGADANFEVTVDDTIKLITEGNVVAHAKIPPAKRPGVKSFKNEMSTLFTKDSDSAHCAMRQFAVLTGVRAHPGSHLYKDGAKRPQLGLGTVIRNLKGAYFLCLQASCDSVRVTKRSAFLFVPLHNTDEKADHFVPVLGRGGKVQYVGLAVPATAYAQSLSVLFDPDGKTQTVLANKIKRHRGLFFTDASGGIYRWVADLKQRRALRTAQKLGQSLGRLGFDEFEPFRKD